MNRGEEREKVKYAKKLEQSEIGNMGVNTEAWSPEMMHFRQPLGKVVSQVEMNNAEARKQLREMLEFQIREKNKMRDEEASIREKIYHHSRIMKDERQLQYELALTKEMELMKQEEQLRD